MRSSDAAVENNNQITTSDDSAEDRGSVIVKLLLKLEFYPMEPLLM